MKLHDDKQFFGSVKIGERGQVIVPKEARDFYKISPGDTLFFFGDKRGMALIKANAFTKTLLGMFKKNSNDH
jgi:AbrB family looped-hinge helix DNA binding protein